MERVANLSEEERVELFTAASEYHQLAGPSIEKDFWICWVLQRIFSDDSLKNILLFKGGTSLSKCFGLIERFSEDIDLIVDWTLITDEDPYAERSNRQQKMFNDAMKAKAPEYIRDQLLPEMKRVLSSHCTVTMHPERPGSISLIYSKAFESDYVKPHIELEFGAMSPMQPKGSYTIQPYCQSTAPQLFDSEGIHVEAIAARKTFWDKVSILHAEAHRPLDKNVPLRYSRHYYDLYQMIHAPVCQEAEQDLKLLQDVVAFKHKFYPQGWANYQAALEGRFKLLPAEKHIEKLKNDYAQMHEMIFGTYPDFDDVLASIADFEERLNGLHP